jgi:hypothetical protein
LKKKRIRKGNGKKGLLKGKRIKRETRKARLAGAVWLFTVIETL